MINIHFKDDKVLIADADDFHYDIDLIHLYKKGEYVGMINKTEIKFIVKGDINPIENYGN